MRLCLFIGRQRVKCVPNKIDIQPGICHIIAQKCPTLGKVSLLDFIEMVPTPTFRISPIIQSVFHILIEVTHRHRNQPNLRVIY